MSPSLPPWATAVIAAIAAIASLCIAFAAITATQAQAIVGAAGPILAVALLVYDAWIRHLRAKVHIAQINAAPAIANGNFTPDEARSTLGIVAPAIYATGAGVHAQITTAQAPAQSPTSPPDAAETKATRRRPAASPPPTTERTTEMTAVGIHAHPTLKLGIRPPLQGKPALELGRLLTGAPIPPVMADHFANVPFGLYENDKYGDCGPTSVANDVRMVSTALAGETIEPSQDDAFDLYRRSGNPQFDPDTGADDNGVVIQTMLEAVLAGGIGDGKGGILKPVAFAKLDVTNDTELEAGGSLFGAIWGVTLEIAQQAQTNALKWVYKKSGVWGGHAILNGAYEPGDLIDVITWAERVKTTSGFRRHQLGEAWVLIWPWHLEHPAFQEGIDLAMLKADYKTLTGKTLKA